MDTFKRLSPKGTFTEFSYILWRKALSIAIDATSISNIAGLDKLSVFQLVTDFNLKLLEFHEHMLSLKILDDRFKNK